LEKGGIGAGWELERRKRLSGSEGGVDGGDGGDGGAVELF